MKRFMKKIDNKFSAIVLVLLLALISESFLLMYQPRLTLVDTKTANLQKLADLVEKNCLTSSWKPACYDQEVPKLMPRISMEDAFKVVKLIQNQDQRYIYCHVVAHKLSFQEAAKNRDAWKDVITRCPTSFCNNGCLHGALMERFNNEVLTDAQIALIKSDLADVCEPRGQWHPVEMERSMCYHGLGHMYMFITDANLAKSLALCEFTGKKEDGRNYIQTCSQGVFMILYQPLEPEDSALVKNIAPKNKAERDKLCKPYSGLYWQSCMVESWPLFRDKVMVRYNNDLNANPKELASACSYAKNSEVELNCYQTWFSILAVELLIDHEDPKNEFHKYFQMCSDLPSSIKEQCFTFGAFRLVQIDPIAYYQKALKLCEAAASYGFDKPCYERLIQVSTYFYSRGTPQFTEYCQGFPVSWREQCLDVRHN